MHSIQLNFIVEVFRDDGSLGKVAAFLHESDAKDFCIKKNSATADSLDIFYGYSVLESVCDQ